MLDFHCAAGHCRRCLGALLGLFLLTATSVFAAGSAEPFYTRHLAPMVQIYGLPGVEGGRLLGAKRLEARLYFDIANSYQGGNSANEHSSVVGETRRPSLSLRYGITDRWDVGIDLPYVVHSRGALNWFIRKFHDSFGFQSSDGREKPGANTFNYRYQRDGRVRYQLNDKVSGWGDLTVTTALRLTAVDAPRPLALRAGLKLPTGDSDELLGSGGTDFSLALAGTDGRTLEGWNLTLHGFVGGIYLGEGDLLGDFQRRFAGFGSFGLSWAALDWLAIKLQFDEHSPLFKDSALRDFGHWNHQLIFGFTLFFPGATTFDIALIEPYIEETAPDVAFHFALKKRF